MWLSVILMALVASIDSLGIGIAYALKSVKVPNSSRIVIIVLSVIYTFIALILGNLLSNTIPEHLTTNVGIIIMAGMGIWIIYQAFNKKNGVDDYNYPKKQNGTIIKLVIKSLGVTIHVIRNPIEGDVDHSGTIDLKESIMLSIALSVDGVGIVLGGTLLGFGSIWVPIVMGIFHYVAFTLGYILFKPFSKQKSDNRLFSALPGIILVAMAIVKLCI